MDVFGLFQKKPEIVAKTGRVSDPVPSQEPLTFEFRLSRGELAALRRLGDPGSMIATACRIYLRDSPDPEDLPRINMAGEDTYHEYDDAKTITWNVPKDLSSGFAWERLVDTGTHIRAAVREFLRRTGQPVTRNEIKPVVEKFEPVWISLPNNLVEAIRKLGGYRGDHITSAVRECLREVEDPFTEGYRASAPGTYYTEFRWNPPKEIRKLLPQDDTAWDDLVIASVRRYLRKRG